MTFSVTPIMYITFENMLYDIVNKFPNEWTLYYILESAFKELVSHSDTNSEIVEIVYNYILSIYFKSPYIDVNITYLTEQNKHIVTTVAIPFISLQILERRGKGFTKLWNEKYEYTISIRATDSITV